jgi:hypothetical protein
MRRSEAAVPIAASERIGLALRPRGASRLAELTVGLGDFGRRRRTLITAVGSLATAANPRVPARRSPPRVRGRAVRRRGVGARRDRAAAIVALLARSEA